MKRLYAVILLLVSVALPLLLKVAVVVYWKANQTYIAQKYCINKKRPQLHCDGKCYLAKQLQQIEEQRLQEQRDAEHPLIPFEKLSKMELPPFMIGAHFTFPKYTCIDTAKPLMIQRLNPSHSPYFDALDLVRACFEPPEIA